MVLAPRIEAEAGAAAAKRERMAIVLQVIVNEEVVLEIETMMLHPIAKVIYELPMGSMDDFVDQSHRIAWVWSFLLA